MATAFPTPPGDDVWGQALINAITSRDTDTANAAATDAQTKATAALNSAKAYADAKPAAALVLGPQDPIPANTPTGTLIGRTA